MLIWFRVLVHCIINFISFLYKINTKCPIKLLFRLFSIFSVSRLSSPLPMSLFCSRVSTPHLCLLGTVRPTWSWVRKQNLNNNRSQRAVCLHRVGWREWETIMRCTKCGLAHALCAKFIKFTIRLALVLVFIESIISSILFLPDTWACQLLEFRLTGSLRHVAGARVFRSFARSFCKPSACTVTSPGCSCLTHHLPLPAKTSRLPPGSSYKLLPRLPFCLCPLQFILILGAGLSLSSERSSGFPSHS